MKAITISQPYASLIASGEKWIENRTWSTSYRGQIAIHAGKGTQYLTRSELAGVPHGCVIAIAELTACVSLAEVQKFCADRPYFASGGCKKSGRTWQAILLHEHAEGPICWVLRDVRKLEFPVPCKGAQGLWEWEHQ